MLGRGVKEAKLPYPDNFFPPVTVSVQLAEHYHHNATQLLNETLEVPVPRYQPRKEWKVIGRRNGLQLFRERRSNKSEAVKVHVVGQMVGTLDDVLLGLYATTNGALKTQRAIMHGNYLDAAVLHVLEKDRYTEDGTKVPYQFKGLKWLACTPIGNSVRKRDLCWYEELGRTRDASGQEVGYLVMQSVHVSACPPGLASLTRSVASVCYTFHPLPNQCVAVYMKGVHGVSGKSRKWSVNSMMAELWLGVAHALECAEAKQLAELASGTDVLNISAPTKTCAICNKVRNRKQSCKLCGKNVCDQCRMSKLLYPLHCTSNSPCNYVFCKPCISHAKGTLCRRAGTSVPSELDRSRSVPDPRAPLRERFERSMLKLSVDLSSTQRRVHEPAGYQKRGSVPLSPQRPPSCVLKARATTSLSSSTCRSSPSLTSGFDSFNDRKKDQPNEALYQSSRDCTNRSLVRTASGSQRPSTSPFRRRLALRSYTDYQLLPLKASPNDSIDNTFDIEEIEACEVVSDESDESDEASDLEEGQSPSLDSCQRQLVCLYDARKGDAMELSQAVDSKPFTDDLVEKEKLWYLNSLRSYDPSSIARLSSLESSYSENVMTRLYQYNIAAEVTYLQTKYNTSITADKSRKH